MKLKHCNNVMDLRTLAKRKLPEPVFHYLDGGADDEVTLRRNTAAFDDYELMPSQLSDVSSIDMKSTLFGQPVDWPVMISPTGASKLFHADGEIAVAKAARKFGMVYSLSTLGTATIEEVADTTDGPKMFQLYMFRDRGLTEEFIQRIKDSGYTALCLTADTPGLGNRERDNVYGFGKEPRSRLRQAAGFLRHPGWLKRVLIDKHLEIVNISRSQWASEEIRKDVRSYVDNYIEHSLTWRDVEWLASQWDGPLVVKGIQSVDDCRKAADSGATAVMISNHGGRQLESAPAPIDCIADVADALRDRLEIICDGGIRRGNHVVKALAAGANACGIGRGYLFGLAAGGQSGVEHALGILKTETERTFALLGCNSVHKIWANYLRFRR